MQCTALRNLFLFPLFQGKAAITDLSRCSKLFYIISRCYFHIESTFSGASVSFVFSHIARYVPSPEENSCIPITHFQCKNNFEHLLMGVIPWGMGTYPPQQRGRCAILVAKVSIYAPYSSRERALLVMWKVQHPKQLVCTRGDFEGVLCIPIS